MPNVRESFLRHKLQKWVNCFHIYLPKVHKLFLQHCLETLPHIRQITILGTAAYFVSCVTSITEMSPVTRRSKPKRERSRGDLRAQRVVCGESTPGPYHHHQHQEASAISYHVNYKYSNKYVSLLFSKEEYAGSTNIVGFHIPSHSFLIMAKETWIHEYPCGFQRKAEFPRNPVITL